MHSMFSLFGIQIPAYGTMIALGIVLANVLAWLRLRRLGLDYNDFLIMEAYAVLGGFIGAKLLFLIVSAGQIEWSRLFSDVTYLNLVMRGGFVFYGGILLGAPSIFLAGKLHKIDVLRYLKVVIFMIPLIHGFGRVGCFLAGCCYGIPYDGILAVTFPEGGMAPSGTSMFPVQLVEAICLLVLAATLYFLEIRGRGRYGLIVYLSVYGVLRFVLERFRADRARGSFLWFSTSQWISIAMVLAAVAGFVYMAGKRRES